MAEPQTYDAIVTKDGPPEYVGIYDIWCGPSYKHPEKTAIHLLLRFDNGSIRSRYWLIEELAHYMARTPATIVPADWAAECKADLITRTHRAPTTLGDSIVALEQTVSSVAEAIHGRIKRGEKSISEVLNKHRQTMRDALTRLDALEAEVQK